MTRLIYMVHDPFICNMPHSYVTWHSHMWHDIVICDMAHSYVKWLNLIWCTPFICNMAHSYVTCLIDMWHAIVIRDFTSYFKWLVLIHTWHDAVICDMNYSHGYAIAHSYGYRICAQWMCFHIGRFKFAFNECAFPYDHIYMNVWMCLPIWIYTQWMGLRISNKFEFALKECALEFSMNSNLYSMDVPAHRQCTLLQTIRVCIQWMCHPTWKYSYKCRNVSSRMNLLSMNVPWNL